MTDFEEIVAQLMQQVQEMRTEIDALKAEIKRKDAIIAEQAAEIARQKEIIRNLQRMLFGQRSEKTVYVMDSSEQLSLFPDAPVIEPPTEEIVVVPEHTRRKKKRTNDEMFDLLPNEDVVYDVPEEGRFDTDGNPLEYLGTERIRRELHSEPQKLKVVNIYVKTYGSKRDPVDQSRKTVVKGSVPPAFYPHSFVTPSLMADVLTKKYLYSMPLNRQSNYFRELGVELPRNTLANWVIYASETYLKPFVAVMKQTLLQQTVIHADETPIQVLKEPNKKPSTKSQFWVYTTAKRNPIQICCYEYRDNRSSECPEDYLKGYTGVLVADGFSSYNGLDGITRAGCWAHMRRYWYNAFPPEYKKEIKLEQLDESAAKINVREPLQVTAFKYCNTLFALEREFESLKPDKRKEQRQLRSKPVVEQYYRFVESISNPGGKLKDAVSYAVNQRSYLWLSVKWRC